MFIVNRSAFAVLLPLVLLVAVVVWSNFADNVPAATAQKVEPARPAMLAQAGQEDRKGS